MMEIAHSYSFIQIKHFSRLAKEHIEHEHEEKEEDMLFSIWLERYPHMVINTTGGEKPPLEYKSFNKFKEEVKKPQPSKSLTVQEIVERTEKVAQAFKEV